MKLTAVLVAAAALVGAASVRAQTSCFYECDDGNTCVEREQVRDGYADCEDGTDETCTFCEDMSACYLPGQVNDDGSPICEDASDIVGLTIGTCSGGNSCADTVVADSPGLTATISFTTADSC